MTAYSQII